MSRERRRRGAAEALASIVLGFESIVVFLGGLVVYGLHALPAGVASWWGIALGAALALLLIVTSGLVRHRWGLILGWIWQAVIAAGALLVPAFLLIALVFGGMYAYATIKGSALDRRNAALMRGELNGE